MTTRLPPHASDKDLSAYFGVSRQTIWRWTREGKFPAPVKLGDNCTRWNRSSIQAWEASKVAVA